MAPVIESLLLSTHKAPGLISSTESTRSGGTGLYFLDLGGRDRKSRSSESASVQYLVQEQPGPHETLSPSNKIKGWEVLERQLRGCQEQK